MRQSVVASVTRDAAECAWSETKAIVQSNQAFSVDLRRKMRRKRQGEKGEKRAGQGCGLWSTYITIASQHSSSKWHIHVHCQWNKVKNGWAILLFQPDWRARWWIILANYIFTMVAAIRMGIFFFSRIANSMEWCIHRIVSILYSKDHSRNEGTAFFRHHADACILQTDKFELKKNLRNMWEKIGLRKHLFRGTLLKTDDALNRNRNLDSRDIFHFKAELSIQHFSVCAIFCPNNSGSEKYILMPHIRPFHCTRRV